MMLAVGFLWIPSIRLRKFPSILTLLRALSINGCLILSYYFYIPTKIIIWFVFCWYDDNDGFLNTGSEALLDHVLFFCICCCKFSFYFLKIFISLSKRDICLFFLFSVSFFLWCVWYQGSCQLRRVRWEIILPLLFLRTVCENWYCFLNVW